MCGIAGYSNIKGDATKLFLTYALGVGIDSRGGDGIGFISLHDKKIHTGKGKGLWSTAPNNFMLQASRADTLVMHSRWATCGGKNRISHAHPFTIKRKNKVVLHGVHNGVITDAFESAAKHRRQIVVDSEEIFHLIADEKYQELQDLSGYGIAMWVMADSNHIKLSYLSDSGEMVVVELEDGGYVWASTWNILSAGLEAASLKAKWILNMNEVGQVYEIHQDKLILSKTKGIKVSDMVWGKVKDQ